MASRSCNHSADTFCYVCGQFIKTRAKKYSVTASVKMCEAHKAYFGMLVGDQDKLWALQKNKISRRMIQRGKKAMKIAIPKFGEGPLTIQAIDNSAWWTLSNVELTRMHLLSRIWTFHHPSPQCHTALSSL
ncbi:uncharacterized protein LOC143235178 [Tachypleus tridentatus]|uniref:uncharacterized protein LOC143235178 n=1 Tax=Tachypleus tridentatus TaxID=6853 RepID=UPI003FD5B98E